MNLLLVFLLKTNLNYRKHFIFYSETGPPTPRKAVGLLNNDSLTFECICINEKLLAPLRSVGRTLFPLLTLDSSSPFGLC